MVSKYPKPWTTTVLVYSLLFGYVLFYYLRFYHFTTPPALRIWKTEMCRLRQVLDCFAIFQVYYKAICISKAEMCLLNPKATRKLV